ncbi:hypothetical protein POL68_38965 [Stigmatella sp. ncwal1]|uniref:Uncharacterized protein n=1 Tax=Stigmatella ashevillensis TaxID=2995309 RepID=A0ABT5DQ33_9BACT|nr:hypothetical protein [Stigmatella ashevillena]MDC0714497.1 hypothetical protein [Stigmatella ashevillena]
MTNKLTMYWMSQSSQTFSYAVNKVKHGDTPTFSPAQLSAAKPVTVTAEQSSNVTPGPEGTYTWNSVDLSVNVACDYTFPAGSSGQLIQVTLKPSKGLQISFDGTNWTSNNLENSWTSTSTMFKVNCFVRDQSAKG